MPIPSIVSITSLAFGRSCALSIGRIRIAEVEVVGWRVVLEFRIEWSVLITRNLNVAYRALFLPGIGLVGVDIDAGSSDRVAAARLFRSREWSVVGCDGSSG
jgi:hypothetical protein